MKIIYAEENPLPAFKDVKKNQFFVYNGELYQKESEISATQIADAKGNPKIYSDIFFYDDGLIERILPEVLKIEF